MVFWVLLGEEGCYNEITPEQGKIIKPLKIAGGATSGNLSQSKFSPSGDISR